MCDVPFVSHAFPLAEAPRFDASPPDPTLFAVFAPGGSPTQDAASQEACCKACLEFKVCALMPRCVVRRTRGRELSNEGTSHTVWQSA